jgi:bacterioferritin (cytochrome b1)
MSDEMAVGTVIDQLNKALRLQYRSALQYTLAAGGLVGLEYQGIVGRLADWADDELHDVRLLVEKITALGGEPTIECAPLHWELQAPRLLGRVVVAEREVLAALHAVIPEAGQEPRSEALEHLVEHLLMRKQQQVDVLVRALGSEMVGG